MRARLRTRVLSSGREGGLERLLAHLFASARKPPSALIQLTCHSTRALFHCDGAGYWEFESSNELVLRHYEGQPRLCDEDSRLKLNEDALLSRALRCAHATTANRKELNSSLIFAKHCA